MTNSNKWSATALPLALLRFQHDELQQVERDGFAAYKGLLEKRGIVGTQALRRWVAEKGCLANSTVKALIDRANN